MATGRTVSRWDRVYVGGYDISGKARSVGPLSLEYAAAELTALSNPVRGFLPGAANVNVGAVNSVFDNTDTTGIHALLSTAGDKRVMTVARGIIAEPAMGDPTFAGEFTQGEYTTADDGGGLVVNIPFQGWAADAASLLFASPWGVILNAATARTAVNTSTGYDRGVVSTAGGGFMAYHVTASSGGAHTATIKVQDSDTNVDGDFDDLSLATTGVITVTAGVSGIVATLPTATIRQYLRWQIVLGTATSVTFVLSLHPG